SAITMPHQYHRIQPFEQNGIDYIFDMGTQVHLRVREMVSLPKARQIHSINLCSYFFQFLGGFLELPRPAPSTMYQNIGRLLSSQLHKRDAHEQKGNQDKFSHEL